MAPGALAAILRDAAKRPLLRMTAAFFMQHFGNTRIIVMRCGPIDLVTPTLRQLK
jgi:hypothetical protein